MLRFHPWGCLVKVVYFQANTVSWTLTKHLLLANYLQHLPLLILKNPKNCSLPPGGLQGRSGDDDVGSGSELRSVTPQSVLFLPCHILWYALLCLPPVPLFWEQRLDFPLRTHLSFILRSVNCDVAILKLSPVGGHVPHAWSISVSHFTWPWALAQRLSCDPGEASET